MNVGKFAGGFLWQLNSTASFDEINDCYEGEQMIHDSMALALSNYQTVDDLNMHRQGLVRFGIIGLQIP